LGRVSVEIRPFDREDPAQVRALWEVGRAAEADRAYSTYPAWESAQISLTSIPADRLEVRFLAWDGAEAVGNAVVSGSTIDNPTLAYVDVAVRPDRRREGLGSRLLERAEAAAREHGRTTLTGEVHAPVEGTSPGLAMALARGYRVDIEDGVKVADLRATRATWPDLAAEVAPAHAGYRLVTAWSPVPDEVALAFCEIDNRFYELAPAGEVQREAETLDLERFRAREELFARAGRHELLTVAFPDRAEARAAAFSALVVSDSATHRAQQGGTVVLPEHRGHRLGLACKLANHRALVERFPEVEWIVTYNADVNAAMNAVNDRLGFRVVERCVEVAKGL
jgi:GNAT superfamily N-acetyltransferase